MQTNRQKYLITQHETKRKTQIAKKTYFIINQNHFNGIWLLMIKERRNIPNPNNPYFDPPILLFRLDNSK